MPKKLTMPRKLKKRPNPAASLMPKVGRTTPRRPAKKSR